MRALTPLKIVSVLVGALFATGCVQRGWVMNLNHPHNDTGLANEATQTVSGIGAIGSLMTQLAAAGLADKVSFVSLNVFGRTIGPGNTDGRQHNPNHQVSLTIGKPFKAGVIGGVGPVGTDFGALPIGSIAPTDSLASFGKTVMAAVGVDPAVTDSAIISGKVVTGAIA